MRYWKIEPTHPVFEGHESWESFRDIVPLALHVDEGTSQKKRGIMVLSTQPVIGRGTSRGGAGLNFFRNSVTTRFLFSTMVTRLYSGVGKGVRLRSLIELWARDLKSCYDTPVCVEIEGVRRDLQFCVIGCKGDWPALAKIGRLKRHHGREQGEKAKGPAVGICHLCKAGMDGYPFHRFDFEAMKRMHHDVPEPFTVPRGGPLTSILPQPSCPEGPAHFYKPDVFHNCHKGLIGDLCANAIALRN